MSNRQPDQRICQEVSGQQASATAGQPLDQRFYVEVERTQYAYIEIVARSKDEADEIAAEMTPRELMECADDWDWDGLSPILTGMTRTEDEL